MNKDTGHRDILQQLIDNTTDVIAAGADGGPKRLAELAHQQKVLTQTLAENASRLPSILSGASVRELQDLVARAMDTVRGEIARNRGSKQAAGIKRKVLKAYGTVTVSNPSSR